MLLASVTSVYAIGMGVGEAWCAEDWLLCDAHSVSGGNATLIYPVFPRFHLSIIA